MKLLHSWAPPASRIARRARTIAGSSGDMPDQLQREVGLDRGADVGRAAGIDRPAAVGELVVLDIAGTSDADRVGFPTQERHQQDVFRLEDRVAFELADPVALFVLPGQQPVAGSLQGDSRAS